MINSVTGLPRHGKGFFITKQILRELLKSQRWIVTNHPLHLEQVEKYLRRRKLNPSDYMHRIKLLTPEQLKTFYMVREIPPVETGDLENPLQWSEASCNLPGVAYFLCEVHIPFDVLDWNKVSKRVKIYLSQHGHLRDEVWLESQKTEKVAKPLKQDVQTAHEIVFLRRQRFLCFQKGYHFQCKRYETGGGLPDEYDKPNAVIPYFFNKEIAACYSTTAGHGIAGATDGKGDGQDFKGLPPWVLYVLVIFLVFGALKLLTMIPSLILGLFGKNKDKITPLPDSPPVAESPVVSGASAVAPVVIVPDVLSIAQYGARIRIQLSDGRLLSEFDGPFEFYPTSIRWRGMELRRLPAPSRPSVPRSVPMQAAGKV